ncbi:hypothetical protein HYFRA_00011114 [Hymenoscyphus fraxineus]|uniref:BZIP domain-containing protein n=1 Tax=Hymenoscyphus fraxineus TaxID=746836 RepID=A0A9N9L7J6_9HELO|nr:hypothetical protein HYFRA_00011114 [Hymenoscyphus fraxineus]
MDSLPTPGTAFLTSLLDFGEDTEKNLHSNNLEAPLHPIQQQSPPTSETRNRSERSTGNVEAAPAQDYSLFQREIERRFSQARESAKVPKDSKALTQGQIISTIDNATTHVTKPETQIEIPLPLYSQSDFEFGMPFSPPLVSSVGPAISDTSLDFETMFSHPSEGTGFEYRSPFSQEATQEVSEPPTETKTKRPLVVEVLGDSALPSTPKKAKGALKKDGKPRARRALNESQMKQKRESFLERNRVAAMKCRSKRKDVVQQLHDDMRLSSEQNAELRIMHQGLIDEVESLKDLLGKCRDTQNIEVDVDDNEKMAETEDISDKEKMAFMDVLIKEGPRRLG